MTMVLKKTVLPHGFNHFLANAEEIAKELKAGATDGQVAENRNIPVRVVQAIRIDLLGIRKGRALANPFETWRNVNSLGICIPMNSVVKEKFGIEDDKEYQWTITKHSGNTFTVEIREKEE